MINVNRSGPITAADIQADHNVEVVNPDQVICTLDREMQFTAELEIGVGRGYCPGKTIRTRNSQLG